MTTDNLIEELTRLEKEITLKPPGDGLCAAGEKITSAPCKKCGARSDEGCRKYVGQLERRIAAIRSHLPAILSALKENKRLRELLVLIRRGIERDKIDDAMILLPYAPDATEADVKPLSALIDAALQPQGEK